MSGDLLCGCVVFGSGAVVRGSTAAAFDIHSKYLRKGKHVADTLQAGESLSRGQSLKLGPFDLTLQDDGNLVLSDEGKAVWATGTNGTGVERATVQNDSNFVLYTGSDEAKWDSKTNKGKDGAKLVLQPDRNVVLYAGGGDVLWASDTVTDTPYVAPAPEPEPEPSPAPPVEAPPAPRTYTVESGDTLWAIAERFYGDGNRYHEIANASGVDNPDLINAGQVLTIP